MNDGGVDAQLINNQYNWKGGVDGMNEGKCSCWLRADNEGCW